MVFLSSPRRGICLKAGCWKQGLKPLIRVAASCCRCYEQRPEQCMRVVRTPSQCQRTQRAACPAGIAPRRADTNSRRPRRDPVAAVISTGWISIIEPVRRPPAQVMTAFIDVRRQAHGVETSSKVLPIGPADVRRAHGAQARPGSSAGRLGLGAHGLRPRRTGAGAAREEAIRRAPPHPSQ